MGINDRYFAVRHTSNLYGDTLRSSSIIMPPLGYIRDMVILRDNIYNDGDKWVELDLLPTTDHNSLQLQQSIQKSVGKQISLMFPMMFGQTTKNYRFDFQVDSVNELLGKTIRHLNEYQLHPSLGTP